MANLPPDDAEVPSELAHARLVARMLAPRRRAHIESALQAGRVRAVETVDLLAPERLPDLALRSLALLLAASAGFLGLELAARAFRHSGPILGDASPVVRVAALILANAVAYVAMLPLHELAHAGVIVLLGGRPRFGLKLPFAAYCTAPGQLFTRSGYLTIALAPLVVLSLLGAVNTWQAPDVGAYILFGLAGNVAGAVGDLDAVNRIRQLPAETLIADTETGYRAYLPTE